LKKGREILMANRRLIPVALVAVAFSLVSPALADMTLYILDWRGSGPGGEFLIEPVSGFSFTPVHYEDHYPFRFETFCIEYSELFTPGHLYYAELNTGSVYGGSGGGDGTFDPLDERTAYIYSKFVTGTLDNYAYDSGRRLSADALQDVIWYLENEITVGGNSYDPLNPINPWDVGTLRHGFLQDALDHAEVGNFYGVMVVNVWRDAAHSVPKQDQLVMIPAPGAMLLGVIGLGAIIRLRRQVS
jgi:hypothetical protein